ncbi:CBS domain-containing protein [Massilia sp. GCM10020059]|uniref:CBS domain-containing protein n=1 Tax=Massilia agrisoli TaxID=2892444 RepID=A0ABS8INP1_9BURK|nr:CBS domain-containing protein [Massilia agrisoli]MCC6069491.1 CBS domain-containing protein [Massilia agrisoli]
MPVSECCNVDVVCCDADTAVTDVAGLMRKHHVGDVIVTEDQGGKKVPVGIVTDRDIVIETIALQVDVAAFTAGDLMSMPLATVPDEAGIVETLRMMRSHKVRRLPVVTSTGALFGIVTADDLINLLAMELSLMTDAIVDQPLREARLRS